MRSRSGIESAFISRSWRSLVQPRMGRQFIAWRRQPQGIPNEPTIILSPRGGGRGNSRQGRRLCRVARADRATRPLRCPVLPVSPLVPGGQGGPRFPGFGVRRGFAIWGPFPVHASDNAPETWTWSTRTEIPRFRRWAWVCDLGAPFRCTHRIAHRKRGPLSTRILRCTLPFQLSMALLALVALFLPTATLASRNNARRLCA